jgi:hypothetical protein
VKSARIILKDRNQSAGWNLGGKDFSASFTGVELFPQSFNISLLQKESLTGFTGLTGKEKAKGRTGANPRWSADRVVDPVKKPRQCVSFTKSC